MVFGAKKRKEAEAAAEHARKEVLFWKQELDHTVVEKNAWKERFFAAYRQADVWEQAYRRLELEKNHLEWERDRLTAGGAGMQLLDGEPRRSSLSGSSSPASSLGRQDEDSFEERCGRYERRLKQADVRIAILEERVLALQQERDRLGRQSDLLQASEAAMRREMGTLRDELSKSDRINSLTADETTKLLLDNSRLAQANATLQVEVMHKDEVMRLLNQQISELTVALDSVDPEGAAMSASSSMLVALAAGAAHGPAHGAGHARSSSFAAAGAAATASASAPSLERHSAPLEATPAFSGAAGSVTGGGAAAGGAEAGESAGTTPRTAPRVPRLDLGPLPSSGERIGAFSGETITPRDMQEEYEKQQQRRRRHQLRSHQLQHISPRPPLPSPPRLPQPGSLMAALAGREASPLSARHGGPPSAERRGDEWARAVGGERAEAATEAQHEQEQGQPEGPQDQEGGDEQRRGGDYEGPWPSDGGEQGRPGSSAARRAAAAGSAAAPDLRLEDDEDEVLSDVLTGSPTLGSSAPLRSSRARRSAPGAAGPSTSEDSVQQLLRHAQAQTACAAAAFEATVGGRPAPLPAMTPAIPDSPAASERSVGNSGSCHDSGQLPHTTELRPVRRVSDASEEEGAAAAALLTPGSVASRCGGRADEARATPGAAWGRAARRGAGADREPASTPAAAGVFAVVAARAGAAAEEALDGGAGSPEGSARPPEAGDAALPGHRAALGLSASSSMELPQGVPQRQAALARLAAEQQQLRRAREASCKARSAEAAGAARLHKAALASLAAEEQRRLLGGDACKQEAAAAAAAVSPAHLRQQGSQEAEAGAGYAGEAPGGDKAGLEGFGAAADVGDVLRRAALQQAGDQQPSTPVTPAHVERAASSNGRTDAEDAEAGGGGGADDSAPDVSSPADARGKAARPAAAAAAASPKRWAAGRPSLIPPAPAGEAAGVPVGRLSGRGGRDASGRAPAVLRQPQK